jgi:hypothetical protein
MWSPDAQAGVQFAAVKFLQMVTLVQSRGVADPRVSGTFFMDPRCAPSLWCARTLGPCLLVLSILGFSIVLIMLTIIS